jgi:hypothetical protein
MEACSHLVEALEEQLAAANARAALGQAQEKL